LVNESYEISENLIGFLLPNTTADTILWCGH